MFPQRDALSTLAIEDLPWIAERDRSKLREATDRITRLAEELDAIRERAAVVQDQLVERRAETGWAFWAVCGLIAVAAAFQLWLFKRLKLI